MFGCHGNKTLGAQIVGAALIGILYLNYNMLAPYLTPLFWGVTLSIVLRTPKNQVMRFLQGLRGKFSRQNTLW